MVYWQYKRENSPALKCFFSAVCYDIRACTSGNRPFPGKENVMRIALFCETYLPMINGVVTHIKLLKDGLEQLGHQPYR